MMSGDGMGAGRKTRRSWSSDLHKRFLSALGQLGGSQSELLETAFWGWG